MDSNSIKKKIDEYEIFVEENLKKDLNEIQTVLNEKLTKHKDWEEVKQVVKTIKEYKEKDRDMFARFELGCGVNSLAEISDYNTSYVNVGLGYLLEMDCEEADKYSDIRMKLLQKEIEHLRQMAVDVKVNIKLVLLAINELNQTLLTKR